MFTKEQGRERETGAGAAILGLILILVVFSAKAGLVIPDSRGTLKLDFYMGTGKFKEPPDGMFYQKDQSYTHDLKNDSREIGISWQPTDFLELSGHIVQLGRAQMDAFAVTCPLDDCAKRDNTLNSVRPECNQKFSDQTCKNRWVTNGSMKGLELFASYRVWKAGPLSVWPGLGLLAYTVHTSAQVYPMDCAEMIGCPKLLEVESKAQPYLSPVIGISLRCEISKNMTAVLVWKDTLRTVQHVPVSANFSKDHQRLMVGLQVNL